MRKLIILTFMFLPIIASAQQSRENGFYGVVTAGPTTAKSSGGEVRTNGYQLGIGYDLNRNIAAELTYGSIARIETSGSSFGSGGDNISATTGTVILSAPMDNFSPYIKGGIMSASSGSSDVKSSFYVYGAGVDIKLDLRTSARIEYLTTQTKDGSAINFLQAGVVVRF